MGMQASLIHIDINHHGDIEDAILQVHLAHLPTPSLSQSFVLGLRAVQSRRVLSVSSPDDRRVWCVAAVSVGVDGARPPCLVGND